MEIVTEVIVATNATAEQFMYISRVLKPAGDAIRLARD